MSNELTRLARNGVQALVSAFVAWLATRTSLELDAEALATIVFPIAMVIIPALVAQAEKLPRVGRFIGLLNGPRRKVEYSLAA